jgi:hypothetical protein
MAVLHAFQSAPSSASLAGLIRCPIGLALICLTKAFCNFSSVAPGLAWISLTKKGPGFVVHLLPLEPAHDKPGGWSLVRDNSKSVLADDLVRLHGNTCSPRRAPQIAFLRTTDPSTGRQRIKSLRILTQARLLGKRIRRHHLTEPRAARVVTSSEAIGDDQRTRGEKTSLLTR